MGKTRKSMKGSATAASNFSCDLCEATFSNKSQHIKHMIEHSEQRPYACDECDKSFRSRNALDRHVAVHANAKAKKKKLPPRRKSASVRPQPRNLDKSLVEEEEEELATSLSPTSVVHNVEEDDDVVMEVSSPVAEHHPQLGSLGLAKVRKSFGEMVSSFMKNTFEPSHDDEEDSPVPATGRRSSGKHEFKFKCDQCPAILPSAVAYMDHVKGHIPSSKEGQRSKSTGAQRYPVSPPSTSFYSNTTTSTFDCNVCGCGFERQQHLASHMKQHSATHSFKCSECHSAFQRRPLLAAHIHQEHPENEEAEEVVGFECRICEEMFSDEQQLMAHMLNHSTRVLRKIEVVQYPCGICKETFSRKVPLIQHTMTHMAAALLEEGPAESPSPPPQQQQQQQFFQRQKPEFWDIKCRYCEKSFEDDTQLSQHMLVHEQREEEDDPAPEEPQQQDDDSDDDPSRRKSARLQSEISIIEEHYRSTKRNNAVPVPMLSSRAPHVCSVCDKRFKTLISLNCHSVMHTGKRPIKKRGPNTKAAVISSMMGRNVHKEGAKGEDNQEEQEEFGCQVCPRKFEDKPSLEKHVLRFHPNKKAFQCDQCTQDFWTKERLVNHEATHVKRF